MQFDRPPCEAYARASRMTTGFATVEPGIELRDGDRFDVLLTDLHAILIDCDTQERDPVRIAGPVEDAIKLRWPDRAYFVEVHNERGWVQIFQPYGVPRN